MTVYENPQSSLHPGHRLSQGDMCELNKIQRIRSKPIVIFSSTETSRHITCYVPSSTPDFFLMYQKCKDIFGRAQSFIQQ